MSGKKKSPKKESEVKPKKIMWIDERDYSNDPFVVKKVERAKQVFEKYGFPKELLNS
jgi:hypothetical protein